jgi:hypothetical protein
LDLRRRAPAAAHDGTSLNFPRKTGETHASTDCAFDHVASRRPGDLAGTLRRGRPRAAHARRRAEEHRARGAAQRARPAARDTDAVATRGSRDLDSLDLTADSHEADSHEARSDEARIIILEADRRGARRHQPRDLETARSSAGRLPPRHGAEAGESSDRVECGDTWPHPVRRAPRADDPRADRASNRPADPPDDTRGCRRVGRCPRAPRSPAAQRCAAARRHPAGDPSVSKPCIEAGIERLEARHACIEHSLGGRVAAVVDPRPAVDPPRVDRHSPEQPLGLHSAARSWNHERNRERKP